MGQPAPEAGRCLPAPQVDRPRPQQQAAEWVDQWAGTLLQERGLHVIAPLLQLVVLMLSLPGLREVQGQLLLAVLQKWAEEQLELQLVLQLAQQLGQQQGRGVGWAAE